MYNEKEKEILKEAICKLRLEMIDEFYPTDIHKENVNFTPAKTIQILEDLGFYCDFIQDDGWEQDTIYYIDKDDIHLVLYYSGYWFTMNLVRREGDEQDEA